MDIGSAIAVFMVLSFLMLALFCFVTKYFHYKLKRNIEESNEVYSMVDEVYQHSEEEVDG
jgi:ABC-type bacteriocin/lantibiotic exporter with double-glycine peptidase domain